MRYADAGIVLLNQAVLLAGINDSVEHARRLAALLGDRRALLNVIPYNPVAELPYRTPSGASVARFVERLRASGLNVFVRERKGDEIDAACGQLRRGHVPPERAVTAGAAAGSIAPPA